MKTTGQSVSLQFAGFFFHHEILNVDVLRNLYTCCTSLLSCLTCMICILLPVLSIMDIFMDMRGEMMICVQGETNGQILWWVQNFREGFKTKQK